MGVFENRGVVVGISSLYVIQQNLQLLPVWWPPSWSFDVGDKTIEQPTPKSWVSPCEFRFCYSTGVMITSCLAAGIMLAEVGLLFYTFWDLGSYIAISGSVWWAFMTPYFRAFIWATNASNRTFVTGSAPEKRGTKWSGGIFTFLTKDMQNTLTVRGFKNKNMMFIAILWTNRRMVRIS